MPIVAQGGTVTLRAAIGHSNGSPADDAAITLSVLDTVGDPVAGFPVALPPIVRDNLGAYHYDWTVPALLAVGDYTATWTATVDGASAGGSETIEVVPPGSIGTTLLTVAEFRDLVETQASDTALEMYLAAAAQEIAAQAGAFGEVTEHVGAHGNYYSPGHNRVVTNRPIGTVTSVTEDGVVLATDDYTASGYILHRIGTGTNPRWHWGRHVIVVYTPADDTAERRRVQSELVKLDLDFEPGLASQQIGTWTETYRTDATRDELRAEILASLSTPGGGMLVVD